MRKQGNKKEGRRDEGKQSELTFQISVSSNIGSGPDKSIEFPPQNQCEQMFKSLEYK